MKRRQVSCDRNAIRDVYPPQSTVESRDASREVQLNIVLRNNAWVARGKNCSGGRRRTNPHRLAAGQVLEFTHSCDSAVAPDLGMNREQNVLRPNVVIE